MTFNAKHISHCYRFGAFVTDSFRPDGQVRGGGECFVYRLKHTDFANQFNKNPPNCGINRDRKEKTRQASVQSCEDFVFVKTEELLEMDEDYFSEEGCTNQINLSDDETHQNPTTPIGETNQVPVSNSRITEYDYSSHKVKTRMFETCSQRMFTTLFSISPMYWTINMNREIN